MRSIFNAIAGIAGLALLATGLMSGPATAAPQPWQMGFQEAASPIAEWIHQFHDLLLILCVIISAFVLLLMIWVSVRFNAKANPTPSKVTHNTLIEVLWTVVPIIILVIIAIPSLRLLYFDRTIPEADITIKATGYQWYWGYEYPDIEGVSFDSIMLTDEERGPDQPRLLAVDNVVVVPVGKIVKMQITASDVIHAWALPAFGVKIDAIPGRLNETWFEATKEGVYYGQCSELCGRDHAFMPIEVHVVSEQDYAAWVAEAKQKFAAHTPRGKDNMVASTTGAAE
ncbi:MAG: cytochrome c oxidase subunit II [Rhodobiaceae bacterium]|nr:cytochrome c oxidase subunit II [Rhodobiaceae bacterium]MCC0054848.1 cytochrome c oxidase subunit II [Rhodobiaceae bacterium]